MALPVHSNIKQLTEVCRLLQPLLDQMVLVGGCATTLLITDSGAPKVRVTNDVDLIVDLLSLPEYHALEKQLRDLGFAQSRDVICRWHLHQYVVDIMPTDPDILGYSNQWYQPAIVHAVSEKLFEDLFVRRVTAPYFLATKLEAFRDRGKNDFAASHDLEDIISVVDGRLELFDELQAAPRDLIHFLQQTFKEFLENDHFLETLPWHLPPDPAGQGRLPMIIEKLHRILDF